jgi:hypothetical protein
LWHGHILSQDGALQLLLIIDFICTWARDVYRPGILRCLAGGAIHLREITPANTQISMDDDDEEAAEDVSEPVNVLLAMRQNGERAQAIEEIEDIVSDMDFDFGETAALHTDAESHDINGDDLARISLDESKSLNDTSNGTAIQNADCSELVWKQIILPSRTDEMLEFLLVTKPNSAPQAAARELLRIFLDDRLTVTATSHWMSSLEHRIRSGRSLRFVEPETPVRVVMHGYSHFNGFDWRIIRQLTCLVCTQDAASALANISEDLSIVASITQWTAHDCGCLEERWEEFQSLQGRRAVVAALTQLEIGLQHDVEPESEGHPKWVSCDEVRWQAIERWDVNAVLRQLESASGTVKACLKILRWDSESEMSSSSRFTGSGLIDTSSVDDVPGLFVKRPSNWGVSCPTWCFVRLDDRNGRGWEDWELAAAALEGGAVYAARSEDGEIASADRAFLTHWIRQMETSRGDTEE